jgi:hypothetical protein
MRAPASILATLGMAALATLTSLTAACGGPPVDLTKALEVSDVSSGWRDLGVVNGQNKLVPAASFKIKNVGDQPLVTLQVNAVFRRVGEPDELGSQFVSVTGSDDLPPGATTDTISVASQFGYTGTEPRAEMLANSQFVDAKVEVSAKYGSGQWTRLGDYPIQRQLLSK